MSISFDSSSLRMKTEIRSSIAPISPPKRSLMREEISPTVVFPSHWFQKKLPISSSLSSISGFARKGTTQRDKNLPANLGTKTTTVPPGVVVERALRAGLSSTRLRLLFVSPCRFLFNQLIAECRLLRRPPSAERARRGAPHSPAEPGRAASLWRETRGGLRQTGTGGRQRHPAEGRRT